MCLSLLLVNGGMPSLSRDINKSVDRKEIKIWGYHISSSSALETMPCVGEDFDGGRVSRDDIEYQLLRPISSPLRWSSF